MKLKNCFLLLLYLGLTCYQGVCAGHDHELKRGMYPYMAFIYYSDPTVVDFNGERFIRSAVLVQPDWLVTTAIGPRLMDPHDGFPKKTLLARAGAVTIDPKFTLNEDEDEQEREIVQIVRPLNHSATQWWTTDISLMKTLLPFNMTAAVGFKVPNVNPVTLEPKTCSILVYAKMAVNTTEEKTLMMLFVELLPPTLVNCGSHFSENTMTCAAGSDDNKDAVYDPAFCHGNSGGPLICENSIVALQTYIGNNCKEPHLYQLLSAWGKFINCTIENKCQENLCKNICYVSYKDPIKTAEIASLTEISDASNDTPNVRVQAPKIDIFEDPVPGPDTTTESTTEPTTPTSTTISTSTEPSKQESLSPPTMTSSFSTESLSQITQIVTEPTVLSTENHELANTKETWPKVKEDASANESTKQNDKTLPWIGSWPKGVTPPDVYRDNNTQDNWKRKPSFEAQQTQGSMQNLKAAPANSESNSNMCIIQTVLFGFTVLLCL